MRGSKLGIKQAVLTSRDKRGSVSGGEEMPCIQFRV